MKTEAIVERIKPATDSERWGGTWRHVDLWAAGLFINYTKFYWNQKEEQRKRVRQGKGKVWSDDGMRGFRTAPPLREIWLFSTDKDISIWLIFICWIQQLPSACPSDSTTTARSTVALLHAGESSPPPLAVSVATEQPLAVLPPAGLSAPVRVNAPASQPASVGISPSLLHLSCEQTCVCLDSPGLHQYPH